LYDGTNFINDFIIEVENYIATELSGHERNVIIELHEDFASLEEPRNGEHYWLWYALTLL